MTDGHITLADVVNAASDVLRDVETGALSAADVEKRAVEEMHLMFGIVGSGPADPLWSLHGDVCRQYLAAGGVSSTELQEWVAVAKRREAENVRSLNGNAFGGGSQIGSWGEKGRLIEKYADKVAELLPNIPEPKAARPTQARAVVSTADELSKLAQLRASGVLTPEEFEAQKAKLLG